MSSSASSAVRENASGVLYDLLTDAAGAGLLEKAVFSKCRDRAVVRIVLTLRLVRNNVVLQAETFRQAEVAAVSGKTKPVQAGQENLPLDSPSGQTRDRLTGLIAACDQINLITTAGNSGVPATVRRFCWARRKYVRHWMPHSFQAAVPPEKSTLPDTIGSNSTF